MHRINHDGYFYLWSALMNYVNHLVSTKKSAV